SLAPGRFRALADDSCVRILPCPDRPFPTWRLGDSGNGDDFVPGDDERPRVTLRSRNLRVHEEILHLLAAPCEMIAGTAAPEHEPRHVALDAPQPVARGALEADGAVLARGADPAPEIGALRPGGR